MRLSSRMASTEQARRVSAGHISTSWPRRRSSSIVAGRQAVLDVQAAGQVGVGREGVGEAEGGEARLLDRLLDIHAEVEGVQEHLQHGLHLHVAARRAERDDAAVVAHGDGGIGREPRPLAGRHARGMAAGRAAIACRGPTARCRAPGSPASATIRRTASPTWRCPSDRRRSSRRCRARRRRRSSRATAAAGGGMLPG